jgi:hypothetical protein
MMKPKSMVGPNVVRVVKRHGGVKVGIEDLVARGGNCCRSIMEMVECSDEVDILIRAGRLG